MLIWRKCRGGKSHAFDLARPSHVERLESVCGKIRVARPYGDAHTPSAIEKCVKCEAYEEDTEDSREEITASLKERHGGGFGQFIAQYICGRTRTT